jgi:hypothetical protein
MDEKFLITAGLKTLSALRQGGEIETGRPAGTHNAKMGPGDPGGNHNDKMYAGRPGGTHNAKIEDPAD